MYGHSHSPYNYFGYKKRYHAIETNQPVIHLLKLPSLEFLQAPVVKKYPAKLSLTSFTCFFGLIQFLIIAALCERDPKNWKIRSGEEVFTILYAVSDFQISIMCIIIHMNLYTCFYYFSILCFVESIHVPNYLQYCVLFRVLFPLE